MVMTGLTFVPLLSFENLVSYEFPSTNIREHSPSIRLSDNRIDYCITIPEAVL